MFSEVMKFVLDVMLLTSAKKAVQYTVLVPNKLNSEIENEL